MTGPRGALGRCREISLMPYDRADLEGIHRHSLRHRDKVERVACAAASTALALFAPSEIKDWVDVPDGAGDAAGVTALCRRCGIDSVLPDSAPGAPLSAELLAALQRHWFQRIPRA